MKGQREVHRKKFKSTIEQHKKHNHHGEMTDATMNMMNDNCCYNVNENNNLQEPSMSYCHCQSRSQCKTRKCACFQSKTRCTSRCRCDHKTCRNKVISLITFACYIQEYFWHNWYIP